jgi:hypothetical protein
MSPEEVHVNRPFQDLGIDPLTAVLARNLLAELRLFRPLLLLTTGM